MIRFFAIALAVIAGSGIFYTQGTATPAAAEQAPGPSNDRLTGWGPFTFGMSPVEVRMHAPTTLQIDNSGEMTYEVMIGGEPYVVGFGFMNNRLVVVRLNLSREAAIYDKAACRSRMEAVKAKMLARYADQTRLETNGHYIKLHFPDASRIWVATLGETPCDVLVQYAWGEAFATPSGSF